MVLDTVRESHGAAIAVEENRLIEWQKKIAAAEGLMICPEAATCIGGLEKLIEEKKVSPDERIVIFNTAAGQKYFGNGEALKVPSIDLNQPTDWEEFEQKYLHPDNISIVICADKKGIEEQFKTSFDVEVSTFTEE